MQTDVTPEAQPPTQEPPSLATLIHSLSRDIQEVLSPGEISQLRRMRPEEPGCPAFWKLAALRLDPAGMLNDEQAEHRWTALLAGMAKMAGLLRRGRRLGRALAAANVAEPRLLRLLRAQGEALLDAVRITAQQLDAAGEPVDWTDFAYLVLSDGGLKEETIRRGIARDYYSQLVTDTERKQP